jgi:probable rRNA maturation factor
MKSGIKRKKATAPASRKAKVDINVMVMGGAWQDDVPQVTAHVRKACMLVLNESEIPDFTCQVELAVVLTDDAYMRDLNHTYRSKDKATNVLSFPASGDVLGTLKQSIKYGFPLQLGDIVLAYETIAREAKEQNKSFKAHFTHLIVHGCLHVLGFDHENPKEAEIMENLEIELLSRVGIENPYKECAV